MIKNANAREHEAVVVPYSKIKMAIAIHVDAVNRTTMVRAKPVIRLFRLAGNAPEPVVYEFEDDVL